MGQSVSWPWPSGWVQAPSPLSADFCDWQSAMLDHAPVGGRGPLAAELARWTSLVIESGSRPGETWILVFGQDPSGTASISAVGGLDVGFGPSLDIVEGTIEQSADDYSPEILAREVFNDSKRARRAVSVRDLVGQVADGDGISLSGRFVGFTHDDATGITVRLEMSSSDLLAFDEVADECVRLLLQTRIDVEGVG